MEDRVTWVPRRDGNTIYAKTLIYRDHICYGSDGKEYLVAADFNFEYFIQRYRTDGGRIVGKFLATVGSYARSAWEDPWNLFEKRGEIRDAAAEYEKSVCHILLSNFPAGHRDDLQRNYDKYTNQGGEGFVAAFTPAASFVYGVACAIMWVPLSEFIAGAGLVNEKAKYTPPDLQDGAYLANIRRYLSYAWKGGNHFIDTSESWWNNPRNLANMKIGHDFVATYRLNRY